MVVAVTIFMAIILGLLDYFFAQLRVGLFVPCDELALRQTVSAVSVYDWLNGR